MADTPGPIADTLIRSRLGGDLIAYLRENAAHDNPEGLIPVLVEGNAGLPQGANQARRILALAYQRTHGTEAAYGEDDRDWIGFLTRSKDPEAALDELFMPEDRLDLSNSFWTDYFLFGQLTQATIERLAVATAQIPPAAGEDEPRRVPLVHKIWRNHPVHGHVYESCRTVKSDAAQIAFSARGDGIVWAVADTGIDHRHPHFSCLETLDLPDGLQHYDFTDSGDPLTDEAGHGSHVAGIIAGGTHIFYPPGSGCDTIEILKQVRVPTMTARARSPIRSHRALPGRPRPRSGMPMTSMARWGRTGPRDWRGTRS